MQQCPGGRSLILKKDFPQHEVQCILIERTCQDCKIVYKQHDGSSSHTDVMCLREQIRLLRQDYEQNKQKLTEMRNLLCKLNIQCS
jgi:ribosomal protein S15P/S13E